MANHIALLSYISAHPTETCLSGAGVSELGSSGRRADVVEGDSIISNSSRLRPSSATIGRVDLRTCRRRSSRSREPAPTYAALSSRLNNLGRVRTFRINASLSSCRFDRPTTQAPLLLLINFNQFRCLLSSANACDAKQISIRAPPPPRVPLLPSAAVGLQMLDARHSRGKPILAPIKLPCRNIISRFLSVLFSLKLSTFGKLAPRTHLFYSPRSPLVVTTCPSKQFKTDQSGRRATASAFIETVPEPIRCTGVDGSHLEQGH